MRLLGIFLSACVVFATLKAAVAALLVTLLLSLLWGFYLHPRETCAFMAYCGMLSVASAHPIAALVLIGLAVVCAQLTKNSDEPP